ncbi:GerAB/ArcD/ProY family transporter [Bacillus sp. REN16]|uniref:GerAB/ArcD/ProY family transporter n=1 Tax=Bacillus sp. REN16 TaxID=2887296 RepID=UPI001E3D0106|nr:GerAB/ArcD/ProY family transporter [Bacillus sp. REN16]MCC3355810.1 spore germination protein [Bacillus sp. REN16]
MERIKESFLVSPYLVFFLIHSMQVGVGILGFQRIIAKSAGYDSWISVILAGVAVHIVVWMMYKILNHSKGDIVDVHKEIFGKWIGGFLSLVFIVYLTTLAVTVLRTYIEVIQVWMFPEFNSWVFGFFTIALIYYIILGGFRTVAGISFFSIVLPVYILLLVFFPLEYAHVRNLVPILNHSLLEIGKSAKDMTLSILGFETLLIFYPFIKHPERSQKWAHLGILATTILYLIAALTAIMYFSADQIDRMIWATLSMFKSIIMPFVERFEYVGIASWFLVILPNMCIAVWGASRGVKKLFSIQQRKAVLLILPFVLIASSLFSTRHQIDLLSNYLANFGFYFVFAYIPILFVITLVIRKLREKK